MDHSQQIQPNDGGGTMSPIKWITLLVAILAAGSGVAAWKAIFLGPGPDDQDPPDPNRPPVARMVLAPMQGTVPFTVSADGSGSSDPDSDPLEYRWTADGVMVSTVATAEIVVESAGSRVIELEVSDGSESHSTRSTVTGAEPEPAVVDLPGGSKVAYTANLNQWPMVESEIGSGRPYGSSRYLVSANSHNEDSGGMQPLAVHPFDQRAVTPRIDGDFVLHLALSFRTLEPFGFSLSIGSAPSGAMTLVGPYHAFHFQISNEFPSFCSVMYSDSGPSHVRTVVPRAPIPGDATSPAEHRLSVTREGRTMSVFFDGRRIEVYDAEPGPIESYAVTFFGKLEGTFRPLEIRVPLN